MPLEPRPVPVFRDPAKATSPPLDEATLREVEAALGYPAPAAYVELLRREQNGGKLRRSLFPHPEPLLAGGARIGYLLGLGGPRGVPALNVLARAWKLPTPGLLIASEGPRALVVAQDGAGPVVYHDQKHTSGPLTCELAPDLASFLAGLIDGNPSCDYVLSCELRLVQERLAAAGWREAENHYGIRRFEQGGLELRVFPNLARDGEGYACVEYPDCPLVAQLHGRERELLLAAATALDAALGPDALRVNTPHPAAVPLD